nr:MAG: peptidase A21 family protein [Owegonang virus 4]
MSDYSSKIAAQVRALGVSPQGERFLMKALYPPGTETQVSIPDTSWHPTMRIDSRPVLTFGVGPGAVVDAPWDACILAVPGDVTAAIVITAPAGTDFSSSTAPANFSVRVLSNLPSSLGGALNKPYYVSSRSAVSGASSEVIRNGRSNPMAVSAFRTTYRGVTLHNTSSSLYNGGTLIAAQFAAGAVDDVVASFTRDGIPCYAMASLVNVPLTDDGLTQMCPGAQSSEARDGCFLPLRLLGPTQRFVSEAPALGATAYQSSPSASSETITNQNNAATLLSSTSVPRLLLTSYLGGGGSTTGTAFWAGALSTLPGKIDDTGFDNVATGIIMLRNLPYQASFSLQAYVGLEAILDTTSPFRSLTMATAAYDPRAISAYFDIVAGMPFAYPASYNSFASILPFISRALTLVKPYVAPFLGPMLRRGADMLEAPRPAAKPTVSTVATKPVPPQRRPKVPQLPRPARAQKKKLARRR